VGADLEKGMTVRDRLWGGRHLGTVVNVVNGRVFVASHGTCVEDELDPADVEVCPPPPYADRWVHVPSSSGCATS
jgi:hypothetical protein